MSSHGFRKICCFLFLCTAFGLGILITGMANGETDSSDIPITLKADKLPLGEALARLADTTGLEFIIDDDWLDVAVSVNVVSMPLHRVLKKLLGDSNNAIVYGANGSIKIFMYSSSPSVDAGDAAAAAGHQAPGASVREDESDRRSDSEASESKTSETEASETTENDSREETKSMRDGEGDSQENEAGSEARDNQEEGASSEEQPKDVSEEGTEQSDSGHASEPEKSTSDNGESGS